MRWLITGGCGFIGRNVVASLLRRTNDRIRVFDNLSVGTRDDLTAVANYSEVLADKLRSEIDESRVELVIGDIRDRDLAVRVTSDIDVVVHLAANTGVGPSVVDPHLDCTTNVIGTLNYLDACRRNNVKRFVFASSGAPIGDCEPPLHEELPAHPVSPYGASKLAGEAYCSAFKRSFGIDTVALRFGNCYGPLSSHKGSVVAKFIREALAGAPWDLYGDGKQTRDFIFVDDVVEAIYLGATTDNVGGEVFQIATSIETTVLELTERLAATLERSGIAFAGMQRSAPRVGDVLRNFSDTRKAHARLGWSAQVSLDEGLDRTVRWFLNQQKTGSARS